MKKSNRKIRRITTSILTFFMSIPTRILAATNPEKMVSGLYGPPREEIRPESVFLRILTKIFIPLVLLIGVVVYCLKSKASKKIKIALVCIITLIIAILFRINI